MSGSGADISKAGLQLGPEDQALFRELCALKRIPPSAANHDSSSSSKPPTPENQQRLAKPLESGEKESDQEEEEEGQLEWSLRRALTGVGGENDATKSSKQSLSESNLYFSPNAMGVGNNIFPGTGNSPMDQIGRMQFLQQQLNNQGILFNPSNFLQSSENGINNNPTMTDEQQNEMMKSYQEMQNMINQNMLNHFQDQPFDPQAPFLPQQQQQQHFGTAQAASAMMAAQYAFHPTQSRYDPNMLQDFYLLGGRTEYVDGVYVRVDKDGGKYIGAYSPIERKKRIQRFHEKRRKSLRAGLACHHAGQYLKDRNHSKGKSQGGETEEDMLNSQGEGIAQQQQHGVRAERMIRYGVRKQFADSRMRVKGRFVKKEDENLLRELMSIA